MITDDAKAWVAYPTHRQWFNKLWLAQHLGYDCGPGGVPVNEPGEYVIRPVMNLYGMGAGAKFQYLTPDDIDAVPPGYFWSRKIEGEHLSVELEWVYNKWKIKSCWKAERDDGEPIFKFKRWVRVEREIKLPKLLHTLWDCQHINVELIDGKIVEVHLRATPDPVEFNELIPVWNHDIIQKVETYGETHEFIESEDFVYGTDVVRLGFYCK